MKNSSDKSSNANLNNASSNPAPLYRQEREDAWDAILNTCLQFCLITALVVCGWTLCGSLAASNRVGVIAQAPVHAAAVVTQVKPAAGFQIAAR